MKNVTKIENRQMEKKNRIENKLCDSHNRITHKKEYNWLLNNIPIQVYQETMVSYFGSTYYYTNSFAWALGLFFPVVLFDPFPRLQFWESKNLSILKLWWYDWFHVIVYISRRSSFLYTVLYKCKIMMKIDFCISWFLEASWFEYRSF